MSWTVTALVAEVASKRIGPQVLNVWRMALSLLLLGATLWFATGHCMPLYTDTTTWLWLLASGVVGYVFGDYCLFNSYVYMGSRWGQLFMMLAPIAASFTAWALLGETLSLLVVVGIVVTVSGIAVSVLGKPEKQSDGARKSHRHIALKLSPRGVMYGIGAGVGQGVGLVLSKVGMEHYALLVPPEAHDVGSAIPFASTLIRACAGLTGLLLVMILKGEAHRLPRALKDAKGMACAAVASVTGPFVGVSLSLMALLYTSAGVAQTLMSLTPVMILWPAHVIFHQKITAIEIVGTIISIVGVSLFFI